MLTGCQCSYLSVQSHFLRRDQLASYYIDTPDPAQNFPLLGQEVIVEWSLPSEFMGYTDLYLEVTIRFANRQELVRRVTIHHHSGVYTYVLEGDDFCEMGGIQTYKVDLIGDGNILLCWRHQLWKELIHVGESNNSK